MKMGTLRGSGGQTQEERKRESQHGRPTRQGRIPAVPIRKLHQALGFSNRCSDELHRVLSFTRWLDPCSTTYHAPGKAPGQGFTSENNFNST